MLDFKAIAKRMKRGVRLLDRKIPNWRLVLRKHEYQFDFTDGECCVLGTLEHYSGRMRVLRERQKSDPGYRYGRAIEALHLDKAGQDTLHGFEAAASSMYTPNDFDQERDVLDALWRAEFEK